MLGRLAVSWSFVLRGPGPPSDSSPDGLESAEAFAVSGTEAGFGLIEADVALTSPVDDLERAMPVSPEPGSAFDDDLWRARFVSFGGES